MSANTTQSLSQDKFLTLSANMLNQAFLENTRTKAKSVYRQLVDGKTVILMNVEMDDESTTRFDLAMDCSAYQGSLNFSAFRANLTQLIFNLGESVKQGDPIPVFTLEDESSSKIFGVTALCHEGDQTNVMALSADMSEERPSVLLKLMYLDHEQGS